MFKPTIIAVLIAALIPAVAHSAGSSHKAGTPAKAAKSAAVKAKPVKAKPVTKTFGTLPRQRRCNSVVHIGDSLSVGLTSSAVLPRSHQIESRYRQVGVRVRAIEASGGRSIHETVGGAPNALSVARKWASRGHRNCWVFALGTNDAANINAGSAMGAKARILAMMKAVKGRVIWVNVKTTGNGYYNRSGSKNWNRTLRKICKSGAFPNMRVYDWASEARSSWMSADRIHLTAKGYSEMAKRTARVLDKSHQRKKRCDYSSR